LRVDVVVDMVKVFYLLIYGYAQFTSSNQVYPRFV